MHRLTWCGRHFSNHGVDTVEPFSFNSHPAGPSEEMLEKYPDWTRGIIKKWHPTGWINQNWLTHLIFYKLASWFGDDGSYNYNTLVYWKFVLYGLAVFCVYATGKLLGVGDMLSAAGACFAVYVGRTFYDIRPAGYSNLLVPILILILVLTVLKNYRLIWLIVPLIVFWANVHGGYLYAFIMLVPFAGIHLLLRLPRRWTLCLGFVGLWLVLYLLSYKFIGNNHYLQVQKMLGNNVSTPTLFKDKILIIWIVLATVSVALTALKHIKTGPFYAYHIGAGVIYFLSIAPRFFLTQVPRNLTPQFKDIYSSFVLSSQMSVLFVFIVGGLLILAMALKKERFVALPAKGIYHTIGAGVVAFIAMIIFNPFHLTNLTHTFEISLSKHAESWRQVNEWKPAFDFMDKTTNVPNPVGDQEAFGVLCILMGAVLLVWLVAYFSRPRPTQRKGRRPSKNETLPTDFQWPKINLAIIVLSFLTIYMAIRSRRFIAIAGLVACPVIALLIFQGWQMITARRQWKKNGILNATTLSPTLQNGLRIGIALAVLALSIIWGDKYKRVYLDPWPTDDRYNSVFMRMTASHLKPFEVSEFINDNQISGRVFNYWTEGGAVAFGQTPDPKTGQTPLKLFMDGRAQAAYDHSIFRLWQTIHAGGPIAMKAKRGNGRISPEQMKEVGNWINDQLNNYDTWVVLMPKPQMNSTLMRALKQTPNWKTAYLDSTQHLLVNIETPQGRELIDKILENKAVFPDAYSKNMTTLTVILENKNRERFNDLYPLTKAAFDEYPFPAAAIAMTRLSKMPALKPQIAADLQAYLDDFVQRQDDYRKQGGYFHRLASAEVAAGFLSRFHPEEKKELEELAATFRKNWKSLNSRYIW